MEESGFKDLPLIMSGYADEYEQPLGELETLLVQLEILWCVSFQMSCCIIFFVLFCFSFKFLFLKRHLCCLLEGVLWCNSRPFWCSDPIPFPELVDLFSSFCVLLMAHISPLFSRITFSWKAFSLPRALCTHLSSPLLAYSQWLTDMRAQKN